MEEKAKLIKLSSKSWHYKLIMFMFSKIVPDPSSMRNLCPYFWMLIAALLISPFVFPVWVVYRILRFGWLKFDAFMDELNRRSYEKWLAMLDGNQALDLQNIFKKDAMSLA